MNLNQIIVELENTKSNEELMKIIDEWEIDETAFNQIIEDVFSGELTVNLEKLPFLLVGFAQSTDIYKFSIFCMLLETYFAELPYLGPAINYIYQEKYEHMLNTVAHVSQLAQSWLAYDLYILVLQRDPKGELFSEEERAVFMAGVEEKMQFWMEHCKRHILDEEENAKLAIIIDIATYYNNEAIIKMVTEFTESDHIDDNTKIFVAKMALVNNIETDLSFIQHIASSDVLVDPLVRSFAKIDKMALLAEYDITQEKIARSCFYHWLLYPTELGEEPKTLEFLDSFEQDGYRFYIYKFTSDKENLKERGEMLGLCGGYLVQKELCATHSGMIYSNFESVEKEYMKQAQKIMEQISNYWKEYAKKEAN